MGASEWGKPPSALRAKGVEEEEEDECERRKDFGNYCCCCYLVFKNCDLPP
jgi:hypothetical protein